MLARVGSMIAPFIATGLSDTAHWLPPLVFGIVPLIGAGLTLFLPGQCHPPFTYSRVNLINDFLCLETRGCQLPETIEDGENFGKKEAKQKS